MEDRERVLRLSALKSNPYGNCKVFNKTGELLFRCGQKKINWYLKRGLATVISEPDAPIEIKLNFEAAGRGNKGDIFLLSDKENRCVVCGIEENLSRHHIVPRCYRSHFPIERKEHNSHDVLPLCLDCHVSYELDAFVLKQSLADIYDAPIHGENFQEVQNVNKAYGYARNIVMHADIIPPRRRETMENYIKSTLGFKIVNDDVILLLAEAKPIGLKDKEAKSHGQLVVERLEDLDEFIFLWRKHFIEHMEPKFMPKGWAIHYKNENKIRVANSWL